jgi:hypothetical protein
MSTLLTPDEWIAKYDKGGGGGHQDPFTNKAKEIWDKTPTPLYDEFMSKRKEKDYTCVTKLIIEDESLFWEYVNKLSSKYSSHRSPLDIRKIIEGNYQPFSSDGISRPFRSDGGFGKYNRFRDTEKALDVSQVYKFPPPPPPSEGQLRNMYRGGHQYVPPPQRQYTISYNPWMDLRNILFETYYNHTAPAREEARKVAEAARIAAEEERKQTAEKNRIAAEEKAKNAALIAMYDL